LKRLYAKTVELIRAQMTSLQTTSIPSHKIEEFRQVFSHFDINHDGQLSRLELKSALSALGLIDIDFEGTDKVFEGYFHELGHGQEQIQFDSFANFMASRETTDKLDVGQIKDSFASIANGKPYVTEDELRTAGIDPETIEYIQQHFDRTENGYDFGGYLNRTFNQ